MRSTGAGSTSVGNCLVPRQSVPRTEASRAHSAARISYVAPLLKSASLAHTPSGFQKTWSGNPSHRNSRDGHGAPRVRRNRQDRSSRITLYSTWSNTHRGRPTVCLDSRHSHPNLLAVRIDLFRSVHRTEHLITNGTEVLLLGRRSMSSGERLASSAFICFHVGRSMLITVGCKPHIVSSRFRVPEPG